MADILSKTTKDFAQDRVVNFDDDEANNFVVLSDDTIEGKPVLNSQDKLLASYPCEYQAS